MTDWTLEPEGETITRKPNGHFMIRSRDGLYVGVTAFTARATKAENRTRARELAERLTRLLNVMAVVEDDAAPTVS